MSLRNVTPALLLVLSLALSACGSSDKKSVGLKGGEADKVRSVAEQVITDPKQVCQLVTIPALQTYTHTTSIAKAEATCKTQVARSQLPPTANVVVLTLKGTDATAAYTTPLGNVGAMTLKNINGKWLMDQVRLITPR